MTAQDQPRLEPRQCLGAEYAPASRIDAPNALSYKESP